MLTPKVTASSPLKDETLTRILTLNLVPEAKLLLIGMYASNMSTLMHLNELGEVTNSPIVDVDFGRVALTADRCNISKSFDMVQLSFDWMEKYVPGWFVVAAERRKAEPDLRPSTVKSGND